MLNYDVLQPMVEGLVEEYGEDMHQEAYDILKVVEFGGALDTPMGTGARVVAPRELVHIADGGASAATYVNLSYIVGSGYFPQSGKAHDAIADLANKLMDEGREAFMEDHPDLVATVGEENIDYHELYDLGYPDEAELLSEYEFEYIMDETVEFALNVAFSIDPDHGDVAFWVRGHINWDSPGHISRDREVTYGSTEEPVMVVSIAEDVSAIENRLSLALERFVRDNY